MFSTVLAQGILEFIFNGPTITTGSPFLELLNGTGAGTVGAQNNLNLALHTGPVTVGDAQTTNQVGASWVNYTPIPAARTTGVWTVTGNKVENAGTLTFPTAGGGSTLTKVWFLTIGSKANATINNKVLFVVPLAIATPIPFTMDDASPAVNTIIAPAHAYADNQEVVVLKTEGAALPSSMVEGTIYFVKPTGKTANYFQLTAATGDGTALDFGSGGGYIMPISSKTVNTNDNVVFDTTNKITIFLR